MSMIFARLRRARRIPAYRASLAATGIAALLSVTTLAGPTAQNPTPRDLIDRAARLVGGDSAIRAIHSRTITSVRILSANFAQEDRAGAPKPQLWIPSTEHADWVRDRYWAERPLGISFSSPPQPGGKTLSFVSSNGQSAFRNDTLWSSLGAIAAEGSILPVIMLVPDRLLQVALDAPPQALQALGRRQLRGRPVHGVALNVRDVPMRIWFDAVEGLIVAADWMADGGNISGEMLVEYAFWGKQGNLTVPRAIRMSLNGEPFALYNLSRVEFNPSVADSVFRMPSLSPRTENAIQVVELTAGVLRLSGPTHSSVAVLQGDETLLLEAPVSARHSRALLDSIRARFPRAPVKRLVASHHHGDHSSGVAHALDGGVQAYVPAEQVDFFQLLGRRWDDTGNKRNINAVSDSLLIGRGSSRVQIHRIQSTHVWGLLVAYLPEHQILFEADLQNSGQSTLKELRDFVKAKGWPVRQVSGVHGTLKTWSEVLEAIR